MRWLVCCLIGACTGAIGEPSELEPMDRLETDRLPEFAPGPAVLPRLTSEQYRNALLDVFGDPLPPTPVEADTNPYLFTNIGATTTTISETGVQQYTDNAFYIVDNVIPRRLRDMFGCYPESVGDACIIMSIEQFGRRLYRRPLTGEERNRWLVVANVLADGDPIHGLRLAMAGMMQSPSFLYRVELGVPSDNPGWSRYDDWEMATRLSILFWNTIPDDELLEAAQRGELSTPEGVREQALRLLEHERARPAVQSFFAQYLDLGRIDDIERDNIRYPQWNESMAESMRHEVELLVDDLVFGRDADVRELFSTQRTFVNAPLANVYGIEAPGATNTEFVLATLPPERAGVLTMGAFLAMNAHQTETSPTLRGKYLRERVLCQSVPAPPDDVNLDLSAQPGMPATLRERLDEHRENPQCAGCHAFIDPPGFLFESFDSIGRFRTEEPGGPVDTTGELDGIPLNGARDLAEVLRDDERVAACLVRQLFRHASGRLETQSEARSLRSVEEAFAASGYRFQELLLELATSDAFRLTREDSE